MSDTNKRNLVYFENPSMRGLYASMDEWQQANNRRLLSISVQQDGGNYCCIALTNPTEVVITSADGKRHVHVGSVGNQGILYVSRGLFRTMIIFGLSPHRCCSEVGHAIEDDLVNNPPRSGTISEVRRARFGPGLRPGPRRQARWAGRGLRGQRRAAGASRAAGCEAPLRLEGPARTMCGEPFSARRP